MPTGGTIQFWEVLENSPYSVTLAIDVQLCGVGILAIVSMIVRVGPFT